MSPTYGRRLRWLQTCQRQQRFQNVQDFLMNERAPDRLSPPHTSFAQNLVTYAGFWNLLKCDLTGSFCLFSAVGTLPTTLQSLSLHCDNGPTEFTLSAFQRFTHFDFLRAKQSSQFFARLYSRQAVYPGRIRFMLHDLLLCTRI